MGSECNGRFGYGSGVVLVGELQKIITFHLKLKGMIRFWSWLIISLYLAFTAQAVDIVKLEDHGKSSKSRHYLLHFSLSDPENSYPYHRVHITLAKTDTILQANTNGEYWLKVWLGYKDTMHTLSIGNVEFTDAKGRYWKQDFCWNQISTFWPKNRDGPQNITLPYKHPTIANLIGWTKMNASEFERQAELEGLVERDPKYVDEGCVKFNHDEFDFDHLYELEYCDDKNMVKLRYGVVITKYPEELNWVKSSVSSLKESLKPYYKETREVAGYSMDVHKFKNNGNVYVIYVVEDASSIMSDRMGYRGIITIKWAPEN